MIEFASCVGTVWRVRSRIGVTTPGRHRFRSSIHMRPIKLAFLLIVLLAVVSAQSQHSLTIPARIERAIQKSEPEWRLIFVSVRKTGNENNSHFRWKRAAEEATVFVNEYESNATTGITPNSVLTASYRKLDAIKGIGDEAYLLGPAEHSPRKINIIFSKGRVRVDVEAPTEAVARQFAKHIARALPAAKR